MPTGITPIGDRQPPPKLRERKWTLEIKDVQHQHWTLWCLDRGPKPGLWVLGPEDEIVTTDEFLRRLKVLIDHAA